MTTLHAWFSSESALTHGSSIFRKPSGSTVNVTRTDLDRLSKGTHGQDEKYLGEVITGSRRTDRLIFSSFRESTVTSPA
jgi:hypothetical protein